MTYVSPSFVMSWIILVLLILITVFSIYAVVKFSMLMIKQKSITKFTIKSRSDEPHEKTDKIKNSDETKVIDQGKTTKLGIEKYLDLFNNSIYDLIFYAIVTALGFIGIIFFIVYIIVFVSTFGTI